MKVTVFTAILLLLILSPFSYSKDITVGVYLSLTGPIAPWGQSELEGIKVAHSIRGSLKDKKVKLHIIDVGSKTEGAALAAEKFASYGIKYVIGPVATPMALAALPVLEKNHIVDVIPTANGMGLTKDKKFASRVCFSNDSQAKVMANYITSLGLKRGVIIEDEASEYSIDLAHRFKQDFEKNGGRIVNIYKIQPNQGDFTPIITNLKLSRPDFIYFANYYNTIALFLRQMNQIGLKTRIFAGSAASSHALVKIAGRCADGLIFTDDYDPLVPQTEIGKRFIEAFKKKYKRLPDSPEALAADAYLLLLKGLEFEGNNPEKVAHFIRSTTFYGVTGKIIIKDGLVKRTVVLRQVKNKHFIPISIYTP